MDFDKMRSVSNTIILNAHDIAPFKFKKEGNL